MRNFIMKWYDLMPFVAGVYAIVLGIGHWSLEGRALLLGLVLIHLHFFEEFGYPGGFAWGGLKIEMRTVRTNVADWQLNQLSALFGNLWFALLVYLPPLFLMKMHWLVLAAIIFADVELLMHLLVFNIGLRTWYNPGLGTAVLLALVSTWFLASQTAIHFSWLDLMIAIGWIILNYWLGFRSPLFQHFNNMKNYTFSRADVTKSSRYMAKFGNRVDDYRWP